MNSTDICAGAAVHNYPKFYVLGCFDKRITFYSQQVRAMSLVYALHDIGYLRDVSRIAVIGAGVAGLTAAAAVTLASNAHVTIFECSKELLPLQMGTERRKLDPHIYDWPCIDTTDKAANLPILDWESGTSREVRKDVINEFNQIVDRMNGRLERRLSHKVKCIERVEKFYKVVYDCIGNPDDCLPKENRVDQFDLVFLAIGFGLEQNETIKGIRNNSYWSDGGVPNAEFRARIAPCYLISGNGDGGLIDLVAAASADFDHGEMIRLITEHPGMEQVKANIQDIDKRARKAQPELIELDLYNIYEIEICPLIMGNGLVYRVQKLLRSGVQLILQTHNTGIFNLNTSALNRLAAFVTIKACEVSAQCSFRHIWCPGVERVNAADINRIVLACGTEQIEVDEVIIRRGPDRVSVREPFQNIISAHEAAHDDWLRRHGTATLVPTLSGEARAFFAKCALDTSLPLSKRLQRQAVDNLPVHFKLRAVGPIVHWTGALGKENFDDMWKKKVRYNLILPDGADSLGDVAIAILRVASHCENLTLYADRAHWDDLVREIIVGGRALSPLDFGGDSPGGGTEEPKDFQASQLAEELHALLDRWMLDQVHEHLEIYFSSGTESDGPIGLTIAPDLLMLMKATWNDWIASFAASPKLLRHFLRLMLSAIDTDQNVAQVLVGPKKLSEIIRGVAVSLAIASSWNATTPKDAYPGNLRRELDGAKEWSGHSYADIRINGKSTLLLAGNFMWQTDFVILAVDGQIEVTQSAEATFRQDVFKQIAFSEPFGRQPVVMSLNAAFHEAVGAGVDAFAEFLVKIEVHTFEKWKKALDMRDAA